MFRVSLVLAACVVVATAFPSFFTGIPAGESCGDWKAGDVAIAPTMGATALQPSSGECEITAPPTSYTAGEKHTITVTSSIAGGAGVILSVKDQCLQDDASSDQLLTGGDGDLIGTKPNQCRRTGFGAAPDNAFEWTAPTSNFGDVKIVAICGNSGKGLFVSAETTVTGPPFEGTCGGAAEPIPLSGDPKVECAKAGWVTLHTVPSMTVCYTTDTTQMEGASTDDVIFQMSVTGQYGAIGFNSKTAMPGTEFMALVKQGAGAGISFGATNGRSGTGAGGTSSGAEPTPGNAATNRLETQLDASEGVMAAKWAVRQWGGMNAVDALKQTFIFATKSGPPGGVARHDHDGKGGGKCSVDPDVGGACTLDVALPATTGNLVHGSLMILAWVVCSPIGTMFVRYLKHTGGPVFFKSHRNLQITAFAATWIGFFVIIGSGVKYSDLEGTNKTHATYGFVVLALSAFQVILGWTRKIISAETSESHGNDDARLHHGPRRYIFNALHKTNGWVLFVMGYVTVHAGLTVFEKGWIADPAPTLVIAWFIIVIVGFLILELFHLRTHGFANDWSVKNKFTNAFNGSKTDNETEKKIRAILLSVLMAFSIATGIALIVVVADTDNTGQFKVFRAE